MGGFGAPGGLQEIATRTGCRQEGGPIRVARGKRGHGRNRGSRRRLLLFVLVASVAAQLVAVFANSGALVALVTLAGLLLCAVVIRAEG